MFRSPLQELPNGRMLRWRWGLATLVAAAAVLVEVAEHHPRFVPLEIEAVFLLEVLVYGGIFPLALGVILTLLKASRENEARLGKRVELEHKLIQQLAQAHEWEELAPILIQFPRMVVPLAGGDLFIYSQARAMFELVAEWRLDGKAAGGPHRSNGDFPSDPARASPFDPPGLAADSGRNGYHLPLVYGNQPVGLLQLRLPPDVSLSTSQIEFLNAMAPVMALAIKGYRPQKSGAGRLEADGAERRRIAKELHDTLGQSLAYLRLRLDLLTREDATWEATLLRQEMEKMKEVANEAYEQVRNVLISLEPVGAPHLADSLLQHARTVGRRAGFEPRLALSGQPRLLPPQVQRQILFIFREILANVEKHARAGKVDIQLIWAVDSLTLIVADDGDGFDLGATPSEGHFGLAIMRERAEEIHGQLTITSALNAGTEVALWLPLLPQLQTYSMPFPSSAKEQRLEEQRGGPDSHPPG